MNQGFDFKFFKIRPIQKYAETFLWTIVQIFIDCASRIGTSIF